MSDASNNNNSTIIIIVALVIIILAIYMYSGLETTPKTTKEIETHTTEKVEENTPPSRL